MGFRRVSGCVWVGFQGLRRWEFLEEEMLGSAEGFR